jgi:ketosteroid isomerase-like protein
MKHVFIICIIAALTLLTGCQKPVDTAVEKQAIKTVLDNYILSIEKEDIELYGEIIMHDPIMVNFGTGAADYIVGWDALRKVIEDQNAALSETTIAQSDVTINVSPDGKFAWATSLWTFKAAMGGEIMQLPVRCSWILEKEKDTWVIVHFHKSVGAAW